MDLQHEECQLRVSECGLMQFWGWAETGDRGRGRRRGVDTLVDKDRLGHSGLDVQLVCSKDGWMKHGVMPGQSI